jgi:hypothetical protein
MTRYRRGQPRPITDDELPYLQALGAAVRKMRDESGLTGKALAATALISEGQLGRIVAGTRRTKRSTLGRLVAVAVESNPDLGPADDLLARLCDIAGPSLVVDTSGPVDELPAPTADEVRKRYALWRRYERAAFRARRRYFAIDGRYHRLNGQFAYVGTIDDERNQS